MSPLIRSILRPVVRAPGAFFLSAGVLGLGMGAAVAIYSVVDAVLLEPLPFDEPERLVEIRTERGGEPALLSMRELEDLRTGAAPVFDDLAAYIPGSQYSLAGDAGPEKPPAILMTTNLFSVLGVQPRMGSTWPAQYDRERNFGLVLSHELWTRQYGASPDLVGGTVALDASPYYSPAYEVFGVMPEGFDFPARTDLYRSIFINDGYPDVEDRESRVVVGVGRLASGVTHERAIAAVARVAAELEGRVPESNQGVTFTVRPLREYWTAGIRPYLLVLMGAALALLFCGCANVANLVLTRTLGREAELALRSALGAGRGRLLMGLAAEGLLLSATGAALALALASVVVGALHGAQLGLPTWMVLEIDGSVVSFALLVAAATGLIVGLWPARTGLVVDLAGRLRQDSRGSTGGARHRRLREALVAAEVALSLALLMGSALLGRTFLELTRTNPGLDPTNVLTFQVPLPWSYPREERVAFQEEALRRLSELPGVVSVALNANPPLTAVGQPDRVVLEVEGQPPEGRAANPYMNVQRVSPAYFETMGIPVTAGRAFDATLDRDSTRLSAIVSTRLAERLWPGEPAIGQRLRRPIDEEPWWEVVGVVGDVRHDGLTDEGGFDVYLSHLQAVDSWSYVLMKTEADPVGFETVAKETIWSIDAGQPVVDVQTMEQRIAATVGPQRLAAALFAAFAVVSLALAAAGIFAVVSVLVRQRTAELGVRMALGADAPRIVRRVLGDSAVPTLVGVALGLAGGAAVARGVRSLLYGVGPWDPIAFVIVPLGIVVVALLAALVPAVRASRLDPLRALAER